MKIASNLGWFAVGAFAGAAVVYFYSQLSGVAGQVSDAAGALTSAQAGISSQIENAQSALKKATISNAMNPF